MGFFKLGTMTLGSVFKKPETILYPFEKPVPPAGLKGQIVNDVEACILCGSCARACTADALRVDRKARVWACDRYRCIQCGYCITACPPKCLSMSPEHPPVAASKSVAEFEVPEHPKDAPKPKKGAPEPKTA